MKRKKAATQEPAPLSKGGRNKDSVWGDPHTRLAEAVLLGAVRDAESPDESRAVPARRWFEASDPDGKHFPLGFEQIADHLGYHPEKVRRKMAERTNLPRRPNQRGLSRQ
jgi:hypothetical protein